MQRMEQDPEELASSAAPRQSESDRPPVGEPLVVSRRNPAARPAGVDGAETGPAASTRLDEQPADRRVPPADLDGRVALVTAATGELGGALAAALVDRGARVLLVDHDLGGLVEAVDALAHGRAVPVWCDLSSDSAVESACEFVARAATLDVVVHVGEEAREADGRRALEDRYRTSVRGPLALVGGLAPSLAPSARVLLVGRPADPGADALDRAAPELVREHLPVADDVRVARAECGADLLPDVFAGAVVDLLARDDVVLERVALAAPAGGAAAEVPLALDGIGDALR
jgi:hypothetical protein